ncbi:hypothetical protein C2G38_2165792 [Gigaspora rosea]|uniref:F-box domain-containing protein n=1 Tax=Gigaspora rosea TaxID=44941 RepID=A0A397VU51_9GLOM|nr:hypothetical protein C2G38_2165792 [Gigaspora rosea]
MPELMEKILNNLNNEIDSLYSCALVLDLDNFERMVKQWNRIEHFEFIEHDGWKKYPSTNLIVNSLLKLFIESGATLHKLVVSFHGSIMIIPEKIFGLLGRNESFFSRLQHLPLGETSSVKIESAIAFLRALKKHTTKISALEFNGFELNFT